MKTVINFFTNKWVIQLIGIIALSLLIWFFGSLVAIGKTVPLESELTRLIVIFVMLILWGSITAYSIIKANRANAAMVDNLVNSADSESEHLAKEVDAEVDTISKNFDEAIQILKTGAKNAKGQNYLYDLPWYIIIGPPGSGKTTALINSGLEFPLADKFGKGALRGVGGTRNCDWWFTDQAVLLDTAGRYVTQDSHEAVDKGAWLGFLELLKKHRPRRPVNGVMITMSLSDLLKQTEEERSLHARAIRQRIEELHEQFGIRFPIYMLFTKADLVAGFTDYFASLNKEERTQVWGVTFPAENPDQPADVIARVGQDFDDLLTRINDHLPRRLQEERDLQRRNAIFGFPQRMALLRESLLRFLQECYGANRYQSAPYLRGVYLTSGTQEGTPIDRLMGLFAQTFKLDRVSTPLFSGQGKSYFITRLLKEVIFEEALLVGTNPRIERMQALLRNGVYSAALATILLMTGLWFTSYSKNQDALTELRKRIEQYYTISAATPNWQSDFLSLLKRMNAMQAISQVYGIDKPLLMTFGLYQGDKLQPVITDTYNVLLQKQFLPQIKTSFEQRIKQKMGNPDALYSLLQVYLMLGDEKRFNAELVTPFVKVDWTVRYATDTDTQAQLFEHLNKLINLPPEKQALDEHLISAARAVLNQIPIAQQVYMRIKNDALQNQSRDLKLLDVLGINADRVFASKKGVLAQQSIPYLFTYDGFYQLFLKQSKQLADESVTGSWVLGDDAKKEIVDKDKLEEAIRNYYYQDYIKYWDELLAGLTLKTTSTPAQAVEVLEFASSPDSPLRKLLDVLSKETSLTVAPPSPEDKLNKVQQSGLVNVDSRITKTLAFEKAGGLGQPAKPLGSEVENHYKELTVLVKGDAGSAVPLDHTIAALKQLYIHMINLSGTSNIGGEAIKIAAAGGGGDPVAQMKAESAHLPEPLKSMTQALANGNQDLILDSSKSQLNRLWQSEVMPLYSSGIQGRYPFAKSSVKEVTLDDFGRFFAPNGVLDQFFNKNLAAFVDTSGKSWRMISQNNQAIAVSGTVLAQLQAASKLRQMLFASGGQTPSVKFSLKPVALDPNATAFWLTIEGQQTKFNAADMAKSMSFSWPGTDGSRLISFGFEAKDGKKPQKNIEGQWALFRMLDMASVQQTSQDKFLVTFEADGLQARYELSASSVDNPFARGLFDSLHLPSGL